MREPDSRGHEPTDFQGGIVLWCLFLLLSMVGIVHAAVYILQGQLRKTHALGPSSPPVLRSVGDASRVAPPALWAGPRHPAYGPQEERALRAEQDAVLTSYAVIDPQRGIVRIPIAQAIKLIVERGPYLREHPPAGEQGTAQPESAKKEKSP